MEIDTQKNPGAFIVHHQPWENQVLLEKLNLKNSVRISLEFYFKGEKFNPSTIINLDTHLQGKRTIEHCYLELAKAGNIGLYSYELEVMLMEPIVFSEPTGIAQECVVDGEMAWKKLEEAWGILSGLRDVAPIANKIFNVENIDVHPKLAAALMEAYQKGYEVASKEGQMNTGMNEGFYG